jgi:hypothetical protein
LDSQIWEDELCVAFERKSGFDDSENEEIWKILNLRILFISSLLMLFTSTTGRIKKKLIPFLISYCYPIDNEILIASVTNGVYRMLDSRIGKVEGWDVLENNVIHHIEKYQNKIYFY